MFRTTARNSSADRTHPLHQSLIFAPFLLNLLLNAASINVFRNEVQLKFAAILRNTRTVLRYLFLVIIYGIYLVPLSLYSMLFS